MAKRIAAKTEEYQKDGETKGKWIQIGVILENDNGEYILLDPTVNLSGVLQKQNMLAAKKLREDANAKAKIGDSIMCSVFTDDNQSQSAAAEQAPAQGGGFDDDIPW
jgi:hypothetical protein